MIVSEETSEVTVAIDGTWTQGADALHLERLLSDLLLGETHARWIDRVGTAVTTVRRTRRRPAQSVTSTGEKS